MPEPDRAAPITETTAAASWQALGLPVQLVISAPRKLGDARALLASDLADLDKVASRFRRDSEVVALARAPEDRSGLVTATVSPLLAEAVAVSLRAASLTDGDLDPTVGAALSALGYDRDFAQVPPNGPAQAVGTQLIPGWRSIGLDLGTHRLTMPPGVQLDLGATVKGWAADRGAARIADKLGCAVLVSLGGDTAVAGPPPEGGWRIRISDQETVAIHEGGLATSSTVARRWVRGGTVLHHILDPRTGLPAAPVWHTVTVAAASCADANTAATAAVIRGWQAPDWLASLRLPARLVDTSGAVHTVAGWPA
ncbi:MAG TPA: FAD:protein FMN transferase [Trebonia sp.]|jgi:thiamine biosynthesis lipoprotein